MAKSDLVFQDSRKLEIWLLDKPIEWAQVIAARAALRVFPTVLDARPDLILHTFRAIFISWAARKYPDQDMRTAAYATYTKDSFSSAADYSAYVTSLIEATSAAKGASITASTAATIFDDDHSVFWKTVSFDASLLEQKGQTNVLIDQPLWLVEENDQTNQNFKDAFDWVLERLDEFANNEAQENKHWQLIVDWYKTLLSTELKQKPYSFFGKKADLAIATQPDEFWEPGEDDKGTEAVLADIAKIVDGTYEGDLSLTQKNVSQEKVSQETFQPTERTDVKPKSDEPTAKDELGRRPFAESLVDKINEVREAGQKDGFAVHLHAPWGAGKTSILLMMQDYMKRSAKTEAEDKDWVVVNLNAWEHERRKPPWWPLIEAVNRDCSAYLAEEAGIRNNKKPWQEVDDCLKSIKQPEFRSSVKSWIGHKFRWCWWKLKTDWLPLVVFLIFGGFVYFLLDKSELITNSPDQSFFMTFLKNLFPLILAALGLYATFLSATRSMVFGSKDSANYYFQLSNDPLGRIHNLFNKLIDGVDRPVCIFIDDLDRCHADFVVDLLEGIQSSFRHEKVTYVVAADKGWIRSAFETRYDTFINHVGDDAQPIGYLFLEKIFQMSTPIPGMAAHVKQAYFDGLLGDKDTADEVPETPEIKIEKFNNAVVDIEKKVPDLSDEKIIQYARENPTEETVAAATKLMDRSPKAEKDAKHLLKDFSSIVSGNPREMKRLLNAFAMRRTISLLQASTVSMDELFRWTILEQSYPALADVLIKQPELVENYHGEPKKEDDVTKDLAPFIEIAAVYDIVCFGDLSPLTADHIRDIVYGGKAKEEL